MRNVMILPLLIGLAGCAGMTRAPSWPDDVRLQGTQMRVSFNDGTVCRTDIARAASGALPGCRWPMSYAVTRYQPSHLARLPEVGGLFQPYAQITLRAPSGLTWKFQTPPEPPARSQGEGQLHRP